jgi:hypothetical protein
MAQIRKFPVFIQFYTTEDHETAFNSLAANSLLTKSALYRLAFEEFLSKEGALRTTGNRFEAVA